MVGLWCHFDGFIDIPKQEQFPNHQMMGALNKTIKHQLFSRLSLPSSALVSMCNIYWRTKSTCDKCEERVTNGTQIRSAFCLGFLINNRFNFHRTCKWNANTKKRKFLMHVNGKWFSPFSTHLFIQNGQWFVVFCVSGGYVCVCDIDLMGF